VRKLAPVSVLTCSALYLSPKIGGWHLDCNTRPNSTLASLGPDPPWGWFLCRSRDIPISHSYPRPMTQGSSHPPTYPLKLSAHEVCRRYHSRYSSTSKGRRDGTLLGDGQEVPRRSERPRQQPRHLRARTMETGPLLLLRLSHGRKTAHSGAPPQITTHPPASVYRRLLDQNVGSIPRPHRRSTRKCREWGGLRGSEAGSRKEAGVLRDGCVSVRGVFHRTWDTRGADVWKDVCVGG
jgi:hypothetical protein